MNISRKRIAMLIGLIVAVSAAVLYFTADIDTLSHLADFHPVSLLGVLLAIPLSAFIVVVWRLLKNKYIKELI